MSGRRRVCLLFSGSSVLRRHVVLWEIQLAQVIQTTVVTLPVYNRHQEPSFFDPACIAGRPLIMAGGVVNTDE